jgi:hypothetical protein
MQMKRSTHMQHLLSSAAAAAAQAPAPLRCLEGAKELCAALLSCQKYAK